MRTSASASPRSSPRAAAPRRWAASVRASHRIAGRMRLRGVSPSSEARTGNWLDRTLANGLSRRLVIAALAAVAALLVGAPVAAQEPAVTPTAVGALEGVGGGVAGYGAGDWFGLGLRLAAVLAVIWVAVLGMRWYVRRMSGEGGGSTRHLQILETRALGPNRALHLVRLGDRAVLIGVTPERINQLMEIDDGEEVARLAFVPAPPEARSLRSMAGGLGGALFGARAGRQTAQPSVSAPAMARAAAPEPAADRARRWIDQLSGQPATRRTPGLTMASDAAPDFEPPSARAMRARAGYGQTNVAESAFDRQGQIEEIQRTIAQLRAQGQR
ncbi:MAG: flagellar biosynthetic protein FliO [Dehalococcoidia bacterium]|nr:flagellar biosynthetic protein FliO [Dehalococcoidia bacterium]